MVPDVTSMTTAVDGQSGAETMLADRELPSLGEVRQRIVALVRAFGDADERGGLLVTDVTPAYRTQYGESLQFRPFGYLKLSGLLSDMDGVVLDYGGGPSATPVVRLQGESFNPSPGLAIHVSIPRGVHEKSRLELMRSLERTSSGAGSMHQLALVQGDEFENCLPENFERVHAGESSTQRAFASHRRKRLEREEQAALEREAYANSIVARVPSPRQHLAELSGDDSDDDDDCKADAQLSLRDEVALLTQAPPEPAELSTNALTWGFLQPVRLATGVKASGAWGVLQRQHSTKDVRAATSASLQPGTLLGKGTNTCTLASWDGEEHCAVGAAELDPTGAAALMYWQVVIKGRPGSLVLGVLRAPCPDKQDYEAQMAQERRRLQFGAVPPAKAVHLSYRTEAQHCADLPNMWPRVWSSYWSVSHLHGLEWSGQYHLHFTDTHRYAAMRLQKAFRRYSPIIKAAKATKQAIDAARPGCRYDPKFYGWGSNGGVYVSGKPPAPADDASNDTDAAEHAGAASLLRGSRTHRTPSMRNTRGPWNVSRIAENEIVIFKLERGKLSFQVPRTGACGSMALPWEDLDGAANAEERRKELIAHLMASKQGEHDAQLSKLADYEIFKQDGSGNLTDKPTYNEEIRRRKARDELQDLADELRGMEIRPLMRRAVEAGAPNVNMPDEFRVCCDLTSECSVTLEHIPPFDPREF
eukprot:COSAG02_NODE_1869_length_10591_cov_184.261056_2_plen_701_part_00